MHTIVSYYEYYVSVQDPHKRYVPAKDYRQADVKTAHVYDQFLQNKNTMRGDQCYYYEDDLCEWYADPDECETKLDCG